MLVHHGAIRIISILIKKKSNKCITSILFLGLFSNTFSTASATVIQSESLTRFAYWFVLLPIPDKIEIA